MRFSRGFMRFAQDGPVVPVALRAKLPWGITTHTLTSSFLANLFWFCFVPSVALEATVLPPLQRSKVRIRLYSVGSAEQMFIQLCYSLLVCHIL